MRKWLIGCGAAVMSVLICGGVAWVVAGARVQANPRDQNRIFTVEQGEIVVEVSESGAIEPVRVVEIKSRVPGRIEALFVDEGAAVRQGQLLARIDPREIQQIEMRRLELQQARASEKQALSQFQNLKIQFAETDVRAPIRGVVTRRYREVGELVWHGGTAQRQPRRDTAGATRRRARRQTAV